MSPTEGKIDMTRYRVYTLTETGAYEAHILEADSADAAEQYIWDAGLTTVGETRLDAESAGAGTRRWNVHIKNELGRDDNVVVEAESEIDAERAAANQRNDVAVVMGAYPADDLDDATGVRATAQAREETTKKAVASAQRALRDADQRDQDPWEDQGYQVSDAHPHERGM